MSLRTWSVIFGVVFLLAGIAGFIPLFSPDGHLLGLFMVRPLYSSIFIVLGLIGLLVSTNARKVRLYFRIIGFIFLIVAVIGFVYANNLYFFRVNLANNWLHLFLGVIALSLGFRPLSKM